MERTRSRSANMLRNPFEALVKTPSPKTSFRERKALFLEWKTKTPVASEPRETPLFYFLSSCWTLKLIQYRESYEIYLINRSGLTTVPSFDVTVALEDELSPSRTAFYSRQPARKPYQLVWRENDNTVLNRLPEVRVNKLFSVICELHSCYSAEVPLQNKSTQTWSGSRRKPSEGAPSTQLNIPLTFVSLSNDFSNLLERNFKPDVLLKTGEHLVSAHKIILAARSDVFCAMFQHEMAEDSKDVIDIKDVEPPVLDAFVKFLYSGKVPDDLPEDMVPKLYGTGDKYAVYTLTKVCSDFLAGNIKEGNFLQILILANSHNDKKLKEAVVDFITKNSQLLVSDDWNRFSEEYPKLANEIYRKYFTKSQSK